MESWKCLFGVIWCILLGQRGQCNGSNILVFMPVTTTSETILFYPLSKELSRKGHNVTVISSIPAMDDMGLVHMIVPPEVSRLRADNLGGDLLAERLLAVSTEYSTMHLCSNMALFLCEATMITSNVVRDMVRSKQHVDLIIIDAAVNDCGLALAHLFNAPFIYVETGGFYPWHTWNSGNSLPSAYTPSVLSEFSHNMNLWQRAENSFRLIMWHYVRQKYILEPLEKMLRTPDYLNDDSPSLAEIEKNVSMILVLRDASLEFPTPVLSNVAKIGCLHCRDPTPIPKKLEDFVQGSGDHGFIIFSLGTVAKLHKNLPFFHKHFLDVFASLPQRVVVKWVEDISSNEANAPENVMLTKWLPQQDLLGHPKCKLFITHGGLLSTTETVYHRVPTVVFPLFWDQHYNAELIEHLGIGIKQEISQFSPQNLKDAIQEVITNSSYRDNVVALSAKLRDQPQPPMDTAVHWIEFVLRHGGQPYIRSRSQDMPWYQTTLLDVILVLLSMVLFVFVLLYLIIRAVIKLLKQPQPKLKNT